MFDELTIRRLCAGQNTERTAALLLCEELAARGVRVSLVPQTDEPGESLVFHCLPDMKNADDFKIGEQNGNLCFCAGGIRGLIYAIGLFLRKTEYLNGKIYLVADIKGAYSPAAAIRGHQLGYRPLSNTYDKWSVDDYRRYYLDLMYFGANEAEHIAYEKGTSRQNALMQYDEEELLQKASALADTFDLNVSLWAPNCENDFVQALNNRRRTFEKAQRLNDVFVPGADPGDLSPKELFRRCSAFGEVLKQSHPEARLWVSAQQPHDQPGWGEAFIEELKKHPANIYGIITGPNHAFLPEVLRKKVPQEYPLRFYPDITHNVRCEYPVHFETDDWHYALTVVNSRESINPRPSEYALLHKLTHRYFDGSVSYSEGVNDDVNKALYSALEYTPSLSVREIIEDYARLFFFGSDIQKCTDALLGLERNWQGDPSENPQIENTHRLWCESVQDNPALAENWRWIQGMFRSECDLWVKLKLIFENGLIAEARSLVLQNRIAKAKALLNTPLPDEIMKLRVNMERHADDLFRLIGQQLGTEKYFADSWERGAVLDTCDLPVTDRHYLLKKLDYAETLPEKERKNYLCKIFNRNMVDNDEYYYSFALTPLNALGVRQTPEFYMDFQGDRPQNNNGDLPVCLFRLFDHFTFDFTTSGLKPDTDYYLTVTYKDRPNGIGSDYTVTVNGHEIYHGPQFGEERCTLFEKELLPAGYTAVCYPIKADFIENGCLTLHIGEPNTGFEIGEFRLTKHRPA